jgi:hypothetical protein
MFNELQFIADIDTGSPLNSNIVPTENKSIKGVGVQRCFFFAPLPRCILLRLIPLSIHVGTGIGIGILTDDVVFFPCRATVVAPQV